MTTFLSLIGICALAFALCLWHCDLMLIGLERRLRARRLGLVAYREEWRRSMEQMD